MISEPVDTRNICGVQCRGRCCDFIENDYSVTLFKEDYYRLYKHGLHEFVTFMYKKKKPQLVNQLNGRCIFQDNTTKLCSIHEIRPLVCRLFPFKAEKPPDWCFLVQNNIICDNPIEIEEDNSSDQNQLANDLYQKYSEYGDIFVQDQVKKYAVLGGEDEQWFIFLIDSKYIEEAKKEVHNLKNITNKDTNWTVFSTRHFSSDLKFNYQILGIIKKPGYIQIPQLKQFPPDERDLLNLLKLIEYNPKWNKYFKAGVTIPDEARRELSEKYVIS